MKLFGYFGSFLLLVILSLSLNQKVALAMGDADLHFYMEFLPTGVVPSFGCTNSNKSVTGKPRTYTPPHEEWVFLAPRPITSVISDTHIKTFRKGKQFDCEGNFKQMEAEEACKEEVCRGVKAYPTSNGYINGAEGYEAYCGRAHKNADGSYRYYCNKADTGLLWEPHLKVLCQKQSLGSDHQRAFVTNHGEAGCLSELMKEFEPSPAI
jgi:hypothetical protein